MYSKQIGHVMKIDVTIVLILIIVITFLTWLFTTLPNLLAGLIIGLAVYCLIRQRGARR